MYNPGVTDISGQLRADGKRAMTRGISEGVSDGFREFQQNKLRNSVLQGENEGLLKAFASDPETAKYAPAELQKFIEKTQKGGGLSLKDNIQFNGMLNATLKTRGVIEEQKMAEQKRQIMQLEAKERAMQIAEGQRQQEAVGRLQRLAQLGQGVGGGVLSPQAQAAQADQLKDPLTQFATQVVQTTGRAPSPTDLREFAERQAVMAARPQPIVAPSMAELEKKYPTQKFDYKVAIRPDGSVAIPDGVVNTRAPGDERQPFQMGQPMGDKNGNFVGITVFDQRSGKAQLETPEGKRTDLPKDVRPITATSMQRHVPDIKAFRKMKADVTDAEISLRNMDRYLESVDSAEVGIARLADTFTAGMKTLSGGKDPLNPKEIAAKAAEGQLQGLLGANRTNVVGGGVLTEQDAIRVIQRLGGEPGALQNPELVKKAIKELYTDRYQQYQDDLLFYNNAVDDYYGSRNHKPIKGSVFSPKLTGESPASEEKEAAIGGAWDENKEKRLEELRRKLGK